LITGIFRSRSVSTGRIALELGWDIKSVSITRRLSRLLDNKSVRVREWYRSTAVSLIMAQAKALNEIRLIVDASVIGNTHQLLMISIALRSRAISIAWTWVPHKKGHSKARLQKVLLDYVNRLIPDGTPVVIVGDSEFGNIPVIQLIEGWGWTYVLRQKSSHLVKFAGQDQWEKFGSFITKQGQKQWLGQALLTKEHGYTANLYIEFKLGEKDAWLLATNMKTQLKMCQAYKRRMWIEELFGDMKRNGFDLEQTKLRHFNRLSRLTLAVVLLMVWLMDTGSRVIKDGKRNWVDRNDRRDYSIFRIGYNFVKRKIGLCKMPKIRLKPYFS
jgi:hypothetical protein